MQMVNISESGSGALLQCVFATLTLLSPGSSAAVASLSYEKVCVLYNIAALQTQVAAAQNSTSDDALKLSAKLFQVCKGLS